MNKILRLTKKTWLIGIMSFVSYMPPAFATLGENTASVQADRTHMNASVKIAASSDKFVLQEMQMPSGTIVREYLAPEGQVFAVTWRGPALPDMHQILGAYFRQYKDAARMKHPGHAHLAIQQSDLILQSSGHMRAFSGKAYVPQLLPKGVASEDIQ